MTDKDRTGPENWEGYDIVLKGPTQTVTFRFQQYGPEYGFSWFSPEAETRVHLYDDRAKCADDMAQRLKNHLLDQLGLPMED